MIKYIKQFWSDFGNLNRGQLFLKYLLPGISIFFTWGLIGHIYLANISLDSLIINKGTVNNIMIDSDSKYHPLAIKLNKYNNEFLVQDVYKKKFQNIMNEISIGDSVKLYTRNYYQTFIGWGRKNYIYQIEKNNRIIFDINVVKNEKKNISKILCIILLIFWPSYIIYKIRSNRKRNTILIRNNKKK